MKKPELSIQSDPSLDYGLSERVARYLEGSPLHVYAADVLSGVPDGLEGAGNPHASIVVELTLVTDGRRGWLVLVQAADEWDVEVEMTEWFEHVLEGVEAPPRCVIRAANRNREDHDGALELREAEAARARIEAEYQRCFADALPCRLDLLLTLFEAFHYHVLDERGLRAQMNQAA
ncbi:MAG: hypothetical protein RID93_02800 [Sandaracinaceae bacterium]